MERLPNPTIDVEVELSRAIAAAGGVRVDALIGKTQQKNADFIFERWSVIAELKELEVDQIATEGFIRKCSEVYERYLSSGDAPIRVFGDARLTTEGFSEDFTKEIANLYATPLRRVVRAADAQIRSTKTILNRPDHRGVLILVNNGNSALDPAHITWALGQHLRDREFDCINEIVFFTANMPVKTSLERARSAGLPDDMDLHVWYSAGRKELPRVHEGFGPALREAWFSHLSGIVGRVAAITGDKDLFNSLENEPS